MHFENFLNEEEIEENSSDEDLVRESGHNLQDYALHTSSSRQEGGRKVGRGNSPALLLLRGRVLRGLRVGGEVRGARGGYLGGVEDLATVVRQADLSGLVSGGALP